VAAALLAATAAAPAYAAPELPQPLQQIVDGLLPGGEDICYQRQREGEQDMAPEKVCVPVGDEIHDLLTD